MKPKPLSRRVVGSRHQVTLSWVGGHLRCRTAASEQNTQEAGLSHQTTASNAPDFDGKQGSGLESRWADSLGLPSQGPSSPQGSSPVWNRGEAERWGIASRVVLPWLLSSPCPTGQAGRQSLGMRRVCQSEIGKGFPEVMLVHLECMSWGQWEEQCPPLSSTFIWLATGHSLKLISLE